jgi:hypothetical protein
MRGGGGVGGGLAVMQTAELFAQQPGKHVVDLLDHVDAGSPLSGGLIQLAAGGNEVRHVGDVDAHSPAPRAQILDGEGVV